MPDPDADIRIAAFQKLRIARRAQGGALPWSVIKDGFEARGQTFLFATQAEGIFRPKGMTGLLSVKTVMPREGRDVWYHDQLNAAQPSEDGSFSYAFKKENPDSAHNQWLRDAMVRQLPLIYFLAVAPGVYETLFPSFITEWKPEQLRCSLVVSPATTGALFVPPEPAIRRYAMTTVQQQLQRSVFRERVLAAYNHRCALSGLPEHRLLDAAHIDPDAPAADVSHGICMSKIHRAAYDTGLIGIDPDLTIHVSAELMDMHDGPLLEDALKRLAGTKIQVPADPLAAPDKDRLAARYAQFRAGT